jgi:hypothetical protein
LTCFALRSDHWGDEIRHRTRQHNHGLGRREQIPEGQETHQFATEKQLAALAAGWPNARLVEIWNSFAGVAGIGSDLKPVKKFTDRKTAVARIWKAIQELKVPTTPTVARVPPKRRRSSSDAMAARQGASAPTPRDGSKKAILIATLQRPDGATLPEIATKMG